MVLAEDCWHRSLTSLMAEIRELMKDRPVYLTFDIDGIDPTYCPGTGESWIIQLQIFFHIYMHTVHVVHV